MNKTFLLAASVAAALWINGCAEKQLVINGMICPEGRTEDLVKSDFQECRYYDLEAATKASKAPMTIECQQCLENKGYKIEK